MTIKEFAKVLSSGRVESELPKTIFYSLLTSFLLLGLFYYFKFKFIENFLPKYGIYLFFSALSFAIILPAIRQVRAYKQFPCMSGMMIGMTVGMISSFLPGFYVGATNGMFVGSVFGMLVGIILGIWLGSCCGIMGFMEGMMAGFMGGLMGAMTSVMLLNDNLQLMTIIVFLISTVIMFSLNIMVYNETKESERQLKEDHLFIIVLTFILTLLTSLIIIYGPRSALFAS